MKTYPVLFTFRFYNGEFEHLDYSIYNVSEDLAKALQEDRMSTFKEAFPKLNKKVIYHFYMDETDEDGFFKDGRAVKITKTQTLKDSEVKSLERLSIAYYDETMELKNV